MTTNPRYIFPNYISQITRHRKENQFRKTIPINPTIPTFLFVSSVPLSRHAASSHSRRAVLPNLIMVIVNQTCDLPSWPTNGP